MELIAHRGMHSGVAKENSREAIEGVLASVAHGIEIDVRITADNVLAVHHDTRSASGMVVSKSYFSDVVEENSHVIRLETALDLLDGFAGIVNVEIKHFFGEVEQRKGIHCVEKLTTVLEGYDTSHIILSSFSLKNIAHARKMMPDINRALLVPFYIPVALSGVIARRLGCTAIHLSRRQAKTFSARRIISRAHKAGMNVRVYTVNSESELDQLNKRGVDGIFTDRVAELYKFLND